MQKIAVVDYGMGNVRSVLRAVEFVADTGNDVTLTGDPAVVAAADRVIFPGQGAAGDCMLALNDNALGESVLEAARNKPFFGICMGLQVLMAHSHENDGTDCLGLVPGQVTHLRDVWAREGIDTRLKIPHMGWNKVWQLSDHGMWEGVDDGARFYFVHSYVVEPEDRSWLSAETEYGVRVACGIARENVFAVQFHPEKSAQPGLRLLKNFLQWQPS